MTILTTFYLSYGPLMLRQDVLIPACLFTLYKLFSYFYTNPSSDNEPQHPLDGDTHRYGPCCTAECFQDPSERDPSERDPSDRDPSDPDLGSHPPSDRPLIETDGASSAPLIPNLTKHGKPTFLRDITKPGFHILYNSLTKSPVYVIEKLTRERLAGSALDRAGIPFTKDERLTPAQSSANSDYVNSGFDRGHLAAAGNHGNNIESLTDTFTLSNMCPQFPLCNRGNWKVLENHARAVALEHGAVYVYSGPMYIPQSPPNLPNDKYTIYKVIGSNEVAVPTHFFKVLIIEKVKGKSSVQCFITENSPLVKSATVVDMEVSLSDVEKWSGLTFDKLHKFV